jgi:hypothetical protein
MNWETLNPIQTFQFQFFEQKRAIEIPIFKYKNYATPIKTVLWTMHFSQN